MTTHRTAYVRSKRVSTLYLNISFELILKIAHSASDYLPLLLYSIPFGNVYLYVALNNNLFIHSAREEYTNKITIK